MNVNNKRKVTTSTTNDEHKLNGNSDPLIDL